MSARESHATRAWARPLLKWAGWLLGLSALAAVASQAWSHRTQWLPLWQRLEAGDVIAVVALCLTMQLLFGLAWHLFLHGRWVPDRLLADQLRWGQSLLAKYLPGKIWQGVARGALYASDRGAGSAFVLFLREQFLSLGISAFIAALVAPAALPASLGWAFQATLFVAGLALTWVAVVRRLPGAISARLPRRIGEWSSPRAGSATTSATMRRVWGLQFFAYLSMCSAFAVLAAGFGLQIGIAPLSAALCFAGLAGVAALFVPAGLGVREAGLFWCLSPLLGPANAAMLALAWRVAITFAEVLFASVSFALGRWGSSRGLH